MKIADVICIVFDVQNKNSLISVKEKWINQINQLKTKPPVILIGNKTDIQLSTEEQNNIIKSIIQTVSIILLYFPWKFLMNFTSRSHHLCFTAFLQVPKPTQMWMQPLIMQHQLFYTLLVLYFVTPTSTKLYFFSLFFNLDEILFCKY